MESKTQQSTFPLVSIITPTFNRARLLRETIESVLAQDYPNFEYLVLDDGSTDDTQTLLAQYGDRLRAFHHENMGETLTVNRGFSLARGEILGVLSSDDLYVPSTVRTMVESLQQHPSAVVAYPDWYLMDEHGKDLELIRTHEYDFFEMLARHHCYPGPGSFFRRALVDQLGGRDPAFRYCADFDFWLRAGLRGPFIRVAQPLARFRHHATSLSLRAKGRQMAAEHLRLVRKILSMPEMPRLSRSVRREAISSAYYIAAICAGDPGWRRGWLLALSFVHGFNFFWRKYPERLGVIRNDLRQWIGPRRWRAA